MCEPVFSTKDFESTERQKKPFSTKLCLRCGMLAGANADRAQE
jgi:hypothetical protein